jgi:hypothetical protein
LEAPNPASFKPYADITEQWAIDVTSPLIDLATIQTSMDGEIKKKKSPSVVPMDPPF